VVGAQAAERGRVIEEYLMRKRQAAVNKARGDAQMGWISPAPVASPSGQPPMKRENLGGDCPAALGGRDVAEREYLSRLRAIRLNNFNERRQIEERKARQGVNVRRSIEGAPQDNADVRKKKIEALRAQADDRAARLKEDLERQRREAYEKEKKSWEDHLAKKGFKQHGPKVEKPKVFEKPQAAERRPVPRAPIRTPAVPVVPMTAAFKEAGIQLPGVADEKPAQPSEVPQRGNETKSPVQQRKDEILKKLNEKIPPDRKKWSQSDEPAAVGPAPFANMTLEQTASVMEATGAGDVVVKNPDMGAVLGGVEAAAAPIPGPRKKWTTPGSTVVNVLQKAAISETITIGKQEIDAATKPEDRALGVTVVKDKPVIASKPINKGTIVIEKSPSPAKGQTIVVKSTIVEDEAGEVEETLEVPNDKKMDTEDVPATKDAWSKTTDKKDEAKTEKDQKKLDDKQGEDKDKKDDKEEMSSSRAAVRTDSTDSNNKSNSRRGLTSPDGDASNNIDISIPKTPTNSPAEGGSLKSLSISPMMSPRSPVKAENVLVDGGSSDNDSVEYVLARESSIDIEREKQALEEELEKALMDQVELDDVDEDEEVNDDNNQLYQTASAGVVLGLQTGFFDADVKLLRTCSEPDLCKLFRTNIALNPFFEAEKQKNDLDLEDIEDEDDEDEDDAVEESENDMKEGKSADVDEDKEDGGEDEDDMESIRKSYQHLLEEGDDDDEDGVVTDNGTEELDSTEELQTFIRKSTNKSMEGSDTLTANGKDNEARKDNEDRKTSGIGDSIEDDDDVDDDDDLEGAIGGDPEVVANWDSGSGESDDEEMHSDDDNESVFSMLEESRARLETELGCDQFMKAYKSIAAIHEDEDENIEDGFKIVSGILGREKEYLYPKILQLVMADGAFIEGNELVCYVDVYK
ncbi:serine/threonine-protein kinase Nek1-like, partial [Saccoglossus kowalevskii]